MATIRIVVLGLLIALLSAFAAHAQGTTWNRQVTGILCAPQSAAVPASVVRLK